MNTFEALIELAPHWRSGGLKTVFVSGCFDLLHPGHKRLLRCAFDLGDILIVGVNSDESVRRLKGPSRPAEGQEDRANAVQFFADHVLIFHEDTPIKIIEALRPDVIARGTDDPAEKVVGAHLADRVVLLPRLPGWSTTQLLEKKHG